MDDGREDGVVGDLEAGGAFGADFVELEEGLGGGGGRREEVAGREEAGEDVRARGEGDGGGVLVGVLWGDEAVTHGDEKVPAELGSGRAAGGGGGGWGVDHGKTEERVDEGEEKGKGGAVGRWERTGQGQVVSWEVASEKAKARGGVEGGNRFLELNVLRRDSRGRDGKRDGEFFGVEASEGESEEEVFEQTLDPRLEFLGGRGVKLDPQYGVQSRNDIGGVAEEGGVAHRPAYRKGGGFGREKEQHAWRGSMRRVCDARRV